MALACNLSYKRSLYLLPFTTSLPDNVEDEEEDEGAEDVDDIEDDKEASNDIGVRDEDESCIKI
jgi:hypothetical protein